MSNLTSDQIVFDILEETSQLPDAQRRELFLDVASQLQEIARHIIVPEGKNDES